MRPLPRQSLAVRAGRMQAGLAAGACALVLLACSLGAVWAFAHVPFVAVPEDTADDGLFVRQALALLHGQWLGAYDDLTLVKGPFYPLFLAGVALAHLPFMTAEGVVYVACGWLLAWAARRATGSWLAAAIAGAAVVLNPVMFAPIMLRPVREGIYVPLTMLICGLVLVWEPGAPAAPSRRAAWAVLLGLLLAAFWTTREEGVWLLPPLAAAWGFSGFLQWRRRGWRAVARHLAAVALALLVAGLAVGAVVLANRSIYGTAQIVELKQPEFLAGYGSLARIRSGPPIPFVAVPWSSLRQAASVSPTAARLLPGFDSGEGQMFAATGCRAQGVTPCDGEIRNAWFLWVLRDAASVAGAYRNARTAKAFYRQLTAEIGAACDSGRLHCDKLRASLAPPFAWRDIPAALRSAGRMLRFMATLDGISALGQPLSCRIDPPPDLCRLYAGFFHLLDSPLFVRPILFSAAERRGTPQWLAQTAMLPAASRARAAEAMLAALRWPCAVLLPWWLAAAVACFLAAGALALRRRRVGPAWLAAAFCVAIVTSRVVVLAYVDAVAIPSVNVEYLSPAYPFLLLFGVLAPASLLHALRRRV